MKSAVGRGAAVVAALDPAAADGGFPASHAGVIAVTDDPASGAPGAFVAPGRDVPTSLPGGRFGLVSGSSYAAAHVSGLMALMREHGAGAAGPLTLITFKPGGGAIDACATLMRAARPACAPAYSTVARQ